ncbi:MAG TPA: hypothetical protein VLX09_16325 [Stellaceae bacterium]|nr:hypothetical protein [Stellaceae bacterium]
MRDDMLDDRRERGRAPAPDIPRRRLVLGAALTLVASRALAQQPAAPSAGPVAPEVKPYEVEGFRSAKFGMTEAEVKKAIETDFNVKENGISHDTNAVERTTILSFTGKDVIPEAGDVRVIYILGYSKKRLFQVVLRWGAGVSETSANSTSVLAGAQLLQNYFLGQQFKPEGRIVNGQLSDGSVLLFAGVDDKGRTVQLQYGTVPQAPKAGEKPDPNTTPPRIPFAQLLYVEDPKNPDVFRIKPGQF